MGRLNKWQGSSLGIIKEHELFKLTWIGPFCNVGQILLAPLLLGGSVVKSPLADTGDVGLTYGLGKFPR